MSRGLKILLIAMACGIAVSPPARAQDSAQQQMPEWARAGLPGPGHAALKPLEGTWRVQKSLYIAIGTRDKPAVSDDIICRREWVAGGRFLQDVTEGRIADAPYFRLGWLGYSNVDRRHEWVTIDGVNANMMIYLGAPGSGERMPISMPGAFTDQGLLGEETAGKEVGMRTVIRIESDDRHVFELYFTPPGGKEFLADRTVYTRMAR